MFRELKKAVIECAKHERRFTGFDQKTIAAPLGNKLLQDAPDRSHRRSFLLADGIQSVQTTASGTIWTSYCDEGVFGNFGWEEPIGSSGLVAWTSSGERS